MVDIKINVKKCEQFIKRKKFSSKFVNTLKKNIENYDFNKISEILTNLGKLQLLQPTKNGIKQFYSYLTIRINRSNLFILIVVREFRVQNVYTVGTYFFILYNFSYFFYSTMNSQDSLPLSDRIIFYNILYYFLFCDYFYAILQNNYSGFNILVKQICFCNVQFFCSSFTIICFISYGIRQKFLFCDQYIYKAKISSGSEIVAITVIIVTFKFIQNNLKIVVCQTMFSLCEVDQKAVFFSKQVY
eukprot:TRINITY_DN101_c0_g1_i1.p2 TRINITY_DN101_c0_g1~~TRINITY_DN101_c0_g1_i1.p2  ORF type:complete len:244 (-),score=-7.26 TRINITY_DN101_c0_g1_i1:236-967(-)